MTASQSYVWEESAHILTTRTAKLQNPKSIFRLAFLLLVAVATSVNALEMGGLIEFGTSELSLLWDSLDDHLWLSAMPPASADRRRQFGTRSAQPPIRVVHYMGTNFGMTGVETFILQLAAAQKRAGLVPSIVMDLENRAEVQTIGDDLGIAVHDLPVRGQIENRLPRKLGTALLGRGACKRCGKFCGTRMSCGWDFLPSWLCGGRSIPHRRSGQPRRTSWRAGLCMISATTRACPHRASAS